MHSITGIPSKSLRIFADRMIDYAGTFPPANLPLKESIQNYIQYRKGPYSWMLSKFICPAKELPQLTEILQSVNERGNLFCSIILNQSTLSDDLKETTDFKRNNRHRIVIDVIEISVSIDKIDLTTIEKITKYLDFVSDKTLEEMQGQVTIFHEAVSDNENKIDEFIKALSIHNKKEKDSGFKLRTGGVDASAFPSSEQIAFVIKTCRDYDVPMKCTAGLHHPIMHYNESVKTKMHGFLNVFGTGIIAYCSALTEKQILAIINDEDAGDFSFSDEGFRWKDLRVNNLEIKEAREKFMISYGSCSFEEPLEDLKRLKFL
ncbi:MAG: hypothetical protein ACRDFC_10340 [Ignavibacteria bacterium]